MQIVNHIAERLAALHSAGYVHRDIKPSNVMWLPRRNRWTLIDFGCSARIGANAPVAFTPAYAPPEVVRAHRSGERTTVADPKADSWSLGMVALEVFCNHGALDLMEGEEQVPPLHPPLPLPLSHFVHHRPTLRRASQGFWHAPPMHPVAVPCGNGAAPRRRRSGPHAPPRTPPPPSTAHQHGRVC